MRTKDEIIEDLLELLELLELLADALCYVPDYFIKKHKINEDIPRLRTEIVEVNRLLELENEIV